jgi:hypothetical protein
MAASQITGQLNLGIVVAALGRDGKPRGAISQTQEILVKASLIFHSLCKVTYAELKMPLMASSQLHVNVHHLSSLVVSNDNSPIE